MGEKEIAVPGEGTSPTVTFRLKAQTVGLGRIVLDFFQTGRPVGSANVFPEIVATRAADESGEAPSDPGEVELAPSASPAPDVVIQVFEERFAGSPGRLRFVLFSTHPGLLDLPVCFGDTGHAGPPERRRFLGGTTPPPLGCNRERLRAVDRGGRSSPDRHRVQLVRAGNSR